MKETSLFMACVEAHERGWGDDQYKGRPKLEQILSARVVAFWYPVDDQLPPTLTIHKDLKDIERYMLALVVHSKQKLPSVRLAKVFMNRREIKIKQVKLIFDVPKPTG